MDIDHNIQAKTEVKRNRALQSRWEAWNLFVNEILEHIIESATQHQGTEQHDQFLNKIMTDFVNHRHHMKFVEIYGLDEQRALERNDTKTTQDLLWLALAVIFASRVLVYKKIYYLAQGIPW